MPLAGPLAGPPTDQADVDMSVALIAGTTFMMATLHMLNSGDLQLRVYSWKIMFSTVATFAGVLLCISFNACVSFFILGPLKITSSVSYEINRPQSVLLACVVFWFCVLECGIGLVVGAIGPRKCSRDKLPEIKIDVKCCTTFLGMIIGFSNLHFWGLTQSRLSSSMGLCLSMIPFALVGLAAFFHFSAWIRLKIANMDRIVDEMEKEWITQTEQVEDQAMGMVLAHLLMQVVRMFITGQIPESMGQDNPGQSISPSHCWALLAFGLLFVILLPLLKLLPCKTGFPFRFKKWLRGGCANCISFSCLYLVSWIVHGWGFKGVQGPMVAAFFITNGAYLVIVFLDAIADLECTPLWMDEEIRFFINPLSLLIGFSWKQAFAVGIATITKKYHPIPQPIETLIISICIAMVVIPAWRQYIIPAVTMSERSLTRSLNMPKPDPIDKNYHLFGS